MANFKTGDGVRIKTREVTADDSKTGLYYPFFGGLVGRVDHVYDDGSICMDVDIESLGEEARKRHLATQEAERKRWLEGLSGEARVRLTEEQKRLKISYKLLVSKKDLEPHKGDDKPRAASTPKSNAPGKTSKTSEGPADAPDLRKPSAGDSIEEEPVKRLTEADLEAQEEEFLRSFQSRQ
jgi:hypothetical protein